MESHAKVSIQFSAETSSGTGINLSKEVAGALNAQSNFSNVLLTKQHAYSFDSKNKNMQALLSTSKALSATPAPRSADSKLSGAAKANSMQQNERASSSSPGASEASAPAPSQRQTASAEGNKLPQSRSKDDSATQVNQPQQVVERSSVDQSGEVNDQELADQSPDVEPGVEEPTKAVVEAQTGGAVDPLLVLEDQMVAIEDFDPSLVPGLIPTQVIAANTEIHLSGDIKASAGKTKATSVALAVPGAQLEVETELAVKVELEVSADKSSKNLLEDLAAKIEMVSQRFSQNLEQILAKTPQGRAQLSLETNNSGQVKSLSAIQTSLQASTSIGTHSKGITLSSDSTFNLNTEKPNWGDAIRNRVIWMVNQGVQKAQLQLHPAELGSLNVRVEVTADETNVTFTAQTAIGKEALEGEMGRLRELFQQQGIQLGDAQVFDHGEHKETHAQPKPDENLLTSAHGAQNAEDTSSVVTMQAEGLLDIYA